METEPSLPPEQTFYHGLTVNYFYKNGKICVSKEYEGMKLYTFWDGCTKWMDEQTFNQLF